MVPYDFKAISFCKCASIPRANHFAPRDQVNHRFELHTATENISERGGLRSAY